MREILFKAKRKNWRELPKEKWWVEGYLVNNPKDGWTIERKCDNPPDCDTIWKQVNILHRIDENTVCQYTGLTDKNGKKIWENDILVAHLDEKFPEDETYEQVIWHESGFCTMEKNSTDCEPLDGFDTRYFAVCGNIFDNAELLERKE